MNKPLVIFLLMLYWPTAFAEAHDSQHRILQSLDLEGQRQAAILVREDGHLHGQPFQVELRVNCSGQDSEPATWKIHDSFSVCDLSPESVKVNRQQTAVALKTKMADHQNFAQQMELGLSSPQIRCEEKTTVKKFSLRHLCDH